MAATAVEEKKIVTTHEAKVRDLQAKVNALLGIEKVSISLLCVTSPNRFCRIFEVVLSSFNPLKKKYDH
jgi:hypothetical protein